MVVNDIDWVIPDFFSIRQGGDAELLPATQNVTFIFNIIDALVGDDRFIGIRKRTRDHRTLAKIDEATKKYRDDALTQQNEVRRRDSKGNRRSAESGSRKRSPQWTRFPA